MLPPGFPTNRDLGPARSPLNVERILFWLDHYPNLESAAFLRQGFLHGFSLNSDLNLAKVTFKNHKSAEDLPEVVWKILATEVSEGRMAGPWATQPMDMRTHPLGLVKKPEPNAYRPIYDLSICDQFGKSVNNCTPEEFKRVSYTSFENIIANLASMEGDILLSKLDLKNAFRNLVLNVNEFVLTGVCYKKVWFVDKVVCFGASTAPLTFEHFSTFLNWLICHISGIPHTFHYLDDFLNAAVNGLIQTQETVFRMVTSDLGVPLSEHKCVPPTPCLDFLGMSVSMRDRMIRAPMAKVAKALHLLATVLSCQRVSVKMMQKTLGCLSYLTRAVTPGRVFLQSGYHAISGKSQSEFIFVTRAIRIDFTNWQTFLKSFNGCTIILELVHLPFWAVFSILTIPVTYTEFITVCPDGHVKLYTASLYIHFQIMMFC